MTISKQPGRPPVHHSRGASDPSKRKINRRSFFGQVAGGVIAGGGGLMLMSDRAMAQVTDGDPYPPAGDPVGGGRGPPPTGVSDRDPTDPAGRGRGSGGQQASPPRSGPAQENPNSALGQARDAGTGRRSVNEVMQGGNAGAEVRGSGDVVAVPTPQGARPLTPAELGRYNRVPGFPQANAQVDSATRAVEQAEARQMELIRQSARAADAQARERIQSEQREAAQAAQTARSAQRVAEIRRDDIVRMAGRPIVRPRRQ